MAQTYAYYNTAKSLLKLDLGLWVIPLTSSNTPLWTGYNTPAVALGSLPDLEERSTLEDWSYGVGVVLHLSHLVMIDIDMHDPEKKNGFKSFEALMGDFCPDYFEPHTHDMMTWEMTTPGKGSHLLFQRPADFPPTFKKRVIAPGVEIIAHGSTPFPPTSRKKDGRYVGAYSWICSEDPYAEVLDISRRIYDASGDTWMKPGDFPLAPVPEWITRWAKHPHYMLYSPPRPTRQQNGKGVSFN